jgi:hypothetical protein
MMWFYNPMILWGCAYFTVVFIGCELVTLYKCAYIVKVVEIYGLIKYIYRVVSDLYGGWQTVQTTKNRERGRWDRWREVRQVGTSENSGFGDYTSGVRWDRWGMIGQGGDWSSVWNVRHVGKWRALDLLKWVKWMGTNIHFIKNKYTFLK